MVRSEKAKAPSKYKGEKIIYEANTDSEDENKQETRKSILKRAKIQNMQENSDDDVEEVFKLGTDGDQVQICDLFFGSIILYLTENENKS